MDEKIKIIVIGAGAAGLVAAGRVAELGGDVLVVEKMKQAGRKLLITGKGRCNISNDATQSEYFKNIFPKGKFLKHAFGTFFKDDIIHLLNSYGAATIVERGGRIFPASGKSSDVLKALMNWIGKYPVEFWFNTTVKELVIENGAITGVRVVKDGRAEVVSCSKVILCTGGLSYPATGSTGDGYRIAQKTGHGVVEPRPALVALTTAGDLASQLKGLKLKNVNVIVWVNGKKAAEEFGEAYIEEFGLDGPVILTLSRSVVDELRKNNKVEITVDLKPALSEEKLDARLIRDLETGGKKQVETIMRTWMPALLVPVFLGQLKIDGKKAGHQLNAKERRSVLYMLKNLRFEVTGHLGFNEAIITAGGVDTAEIDGKTMESKIVKNLFFAGEVIDLDANTGGFNLQIAFSSAWLAAGSCVKGTCPG